MKTLPSFFPSSRPNSLSMRMMFVIVMLLTMGYWSLSSPDALATPNMCTVCHKRTTTITGLACNSLEYRRHKDHGDPDGPCAASRATKEDLVKEK